MYEYTPFTKLLDNITIVYYIEICDYPNIQPTKVVFLLELKYHVILHIKNTYFLSTHENKYLGCRYLWKCFREPIVVLRRCFMSNCIEYNMTIICYSIRTCVCTSRVNFNTDGLTVKIIIKKVIKQLLIIRTS